MLIAFAARVTLSIEDKEDREAEEDREDREDKEDREYMEDREDKEDREEVEDKRMLGCSRQQKGGRCLEYIIVIRWYTSSV